MSALSLIFDVLLMGLLGVTIFYAIRLSKQLKVFRDSRKELEKLMAKLATHIEGAEHAINGLKRSAGHTGEDLQRLIHDAQNLSEELQFILDSGDRIADRIDQAVSRSKGTGADAGAELGTRRASRSKARPEQSKTRVAAKATGKAAPAGGFAIRDPEWERDDIDPETENDFLDDNDNDDDAGGGAALYSRAEQELFNALKEKRRVTSDEG